MFGKNDNDDLTMARYSNWIAECNINNVLTTPSWSSTHTHTRIHEHQHINSNSVQSLWSIQNTLLYVYYKATINLNSIQLKWTQFPILLAPFYRLRLIIISFCACEGDGTEKLNDMSINFAEKMSFFPLPNRNVFPRLFWKWANKQCQMV